MPYKVVDLWLMFCHFCVWNDDCCVETPQPFILLFSKPTFLPNKHNRTGQDQIILPFSFQFQNSMKYFSPSGKRQDVLKMIKRQMWYNCLAINEQMINFQHYQPNNYGCRFMHISIVDCRFASFIVDVDFRQKAIVDCRQKGPKSCDLHLIRNPPHPPP